MNRLEQQMQFIIEIDQLKKIVRQSHLIDGSRHENDTEHSWHIAMMAMILAEYANEPVEVLRVIQMLLIHDIVEIDAGDTYAYDEVGYEDKMIREQKAADRIFGLLPEDQGMALRAMWDEFEACETKEAKFAHTLDRVHPMYLNYLSGGRAWQAHQIHIDQVMKKNSYAAEGSQVIWDHTKKMLDDAVKKGYLRSE